MKRGDIIIVNIGGNIGKPRPAVIIQADILNNNDKLDTTIVLPITSDILNVNIIRYLIKPSKNNGLKTVSQVMIEKITQLNKGKIQKIVGCLSKKQLNEIEARMLAILGVR